MRFQSKCFYILAIAILGLLVSGCIPLPHYEWESPAISGTVLQDGKPVEGAVIQLRSRYAGDVKTARTDSTGKFTIWPLKSFEFVYGLLGDRIFQYTLMINIGGNDYTGYDGGGLGYIGKSLMLTCELKTPGDASNRAENCS